ncbi:MAG: ABC transporter permease [Candidatus Eisenbacteria bacterium]
MRLFGVVPVLRKELIHIRRDPKTVAALFAIPVAMILLYGYALDLDVKDVEIAVADRSGSAESRDLIRRLTGSGVFRVVEEVARGDEADRLFRERMAKGVVVIPPRYGRDEGEPVQLLVDGSDPNTANILIGYMSSVVSRVRLERIAPGPPPLSAEIRVLYNPEMESSRFMVPGLVAVILMMASALLTSVTIAREKETGSLEQLLVSPVGASAIVVGKVIPYVFLALLDGAVILVAGSLLFGVGIEGSIALLLLFALVYVFASLSLGVLISTVAGSQQVAMTVSLMVTMLPTVMLSGFIFNVSSMPAYLRAISRIIPATYFLKIIRGIVLKGSGIRELAEPASALLVIGALLLTASVVLFRRRVE